MDYFDMAESLRKKKFEGVAIESLKPGYYDGCTKIDREMDEILEVMEKNSTTVRYDGPPITSPSPGKHKSGIIPRIQEFVDIAKTMSQGSGGGIVRQM